MPRLLISIYIFAIYFLHLGAQQPDSCLEKNEKYILAHETAFVPLHVEGEIVNINKASDGSYYALELNKEWVGVKEILHNRARLWTSNDLVHWSDRGSLCLLDGQASFSKKNGTNQKPDLFEGKISLDFVLEHWWLTIERRRYKSQTIKPGGPYNFFTETGNIMFEDQGKLYDYPLVNQKYILQVDPNKISDDVFISFKQKAEDLMASPLGILNINDTYVLFSYEDHLYHRTIYYSTSNKLNGKYGWPKLLFKSGFYAHGIPFQDEYGNWWAMVYRPTNHQNNKTDPSATWLVPLELRQKRHRITFAVKDKRFAPKQNEIESARKSVRLKSLNFK